MDDNNWLLLSYKISDNGQSEQISESDIEEFSSKSSGFNWIHLNGNDPRSEQWLYENSGLEQLWIMALLAQDTRPNITTLDNGAIIVILRSINLNVNEEPEDMISIRLYIDKHQIISVRLRKLNAIDEIERKVILKKGPKNSSEFIATLVYLLCNKLDPMFSQMNEELDIVEEEILDKPDIVLRQQITDLRKKVILFRRYLAPQRDVLHTLSFLDKKWLYKKDRHSLAESLNKTIRYIEDLDSMRERTQVVQDELNNYLTDRLNKNTYRLSIMASIFWPLSFLTGLVGVNLAGIPGADSPLAFTVFNIVLVAVIFIQIALFKWLDWF